MSKKIVSLYLTDNEFKMLDELIAARFPLSKRGTVAGVLFQTVLTEEHRKVVKEANRVSRSAK